MNYKEYLKTERWKNTRARKMRNAEWICECCGNDFAKEVHHKHYNSLLKKKIQTCWHFVSLAITGQIEIENITLD